MYVAMYVAVNMYDYLHSYVHTDTYLLVTYTYVRM